MYNICYLSSASVPFTESELKELLVRARQNNLSQGITGMLLYKEGNFLQIIEGDESAVSKLYSKIAKDSRHHGITELFSEAIAHRAFSDWSMAFRNLDGLSGEHPEGFNDILNSDWDQVDLTSYAPKLRAFMKHFL